MKPMSSFFALCAALVVLVVSTSLYTVPETQRALVLRLGQLDQDAAGNPEVKMPGLHFKLPFVSRVLYFDKRLQTLEIKDARIVTKEKKDVLVNSFTKWRVGNYAQFYKATAGDFMRAGQLLSQKVGDALRAEFGKRTIQDVVAGERVDVMALIYTAIKETSKSIGLDVVDVRIKRIDLPTEVSDSVYERMRAERQQAAAEHRADGQREAEKIRADADKQVVVLLAEADKTSKQYRGQGDARAAEIYAEAYGQDPEFYAFYRSLDAYKASFASKDDLLVLSPDNQFFKYFKQEQKIG